jgi:MFS family permease
MRGGERPPGRAVLFFAAIGLGFLLLEIALIQRFVLFLGFPTYALSVVLFSLLAFTGIGSLLSTRLGDARRTLIAALAFACILIAAAAYGLQPLLRELVEWPFAARVALSVVLLAPAGLALGMAMPIGLTRLAGLHPGAVPWGWAVNGIASVLGSVLAVAIAVTWGFAVVTLLALASYLVALADAWRGRWPARA